MSLAFGNTATTPSTPPSVSRVKKCAPEDVQMFPTPASVQINPGDMLLWNASTHQVALMSNATWDTNILTSQENVAPVFLGIAAGQKNAADPTNTPIPVITRGYAAYPAAAVNTIYDPGALVAAAAQGTHNLDDQKVIICANILGAIGYMCQLELANAVEYAFYFQSSLIYGGLQAATP